MSFQLTGKQATLLRQVGRHYPELLELLTDLRAQELERLALTSPDVFPTLKGRVGMLTDLRQHMMVP